MKTAGPLTLLPGLVLLCTGLLAACAGVNAPKKEPLSLSNSVEGTNRQTIDDVKLSCIADAARKLNELSGKELRYTVLENDIAVIGGKVVANCKIAVAS